MPLRFIAPYALLAAASIAANFTDPFTGVGILKALPTCILTAAALLYTRPRFGYLVTIAVFCGACGDFFLASMSKDWFIPGLVAFLIGHLFYIAAFARGFKTRPLPLLILGIMTLALIAFAAITVVRLANTQQASMIAPSILYTLILGATMAVCLLRTSPTPWIAAGAVIFVTSDLHIAVNHVLLDVPLLPITLSGYTTYYLAQFLIIHGAAREATPLQEP